MEFAPGIPNKKKKTAIPIISKPIITNFVLHEHHAEKAGKHFDFRIALNNKAYSWAMRYFPETNGERRLAVRQPDHTIQYMRFSGTIEDGYGKGNVFIKNSGKIRVIYTNLKTIKFVFISERDNREFILRHTSGDNWIMINVTRVRSDSDPSSKDKYKDFTSKDISKLLERSNYVAQPKIDGAHGVLILEPNKFPKIISYRVSKSTSTGLIDHTHKFRDLKLVKIPKELAGTYRGEIYAESSSGIVPAEELAGILNSLTSNSLETQKKRGVKLKLALFGTDKNKLREIKSLLGPCITLLPISKTKASKEKLLESVMSGKNKFTREGLVFIDDNTKKYIKYKLRPDFDVYIKSIFEGSGKYEGMAGGFYYSYSRSGQPIGKVGTGFTDNQRRDMWNNKDKYIGKVATVFASRKLKSGVLFQPSFYRLHPDKN